MFRVDRIIIFLYIASLACLLVSKTVMPFVDELATVFLIMLAIIDSAVNHRWRQYSGLWALFGIMAFYCVYSVTLLHFNSVPYILLDALLEAKPFVAFFTFLAIAPVLTSRDKLILRISSLTVGCLSVLVLLCGMRLTKTILGHPFVAGSLVFLGAISYWFSVSDDKGDLTLRDKMIILSLLCGGLLCTRSEYYGCFVLAVYFLFMYRPGVLRHLNIKHIITMAAVGVIVIAVTWNKISFYFITGASDTVDINLIDSMARAALLFTTPLILMDYFPFGSGLASFASYPSSANYSGLYSEYSLDKVWGLSPTMPDFITDLYFASLAQVGIIGIALFIYFWIYVYRYLRFMIRLDAKRYHSYFSIGCLIICYILIECIGGNTFVQPSGQVAMMLLGIICGQGKRLMHKADTAHGAPLENQDNSPHLPEKTLRHKI